MMIPALYQSIAVKWLFLLINEWVILMGRIDPKQIPKTVKLFQIDLLSLICAVGMIEDTEAYWREVMDECNRVYMLHENELAKRLVMTIAGYLDDQARERRSKEK